MIAAMTMMIVVGDKKYAGQDSNTQRKTARIKHLALLTTQTQMYLREMIVGAIKKKKKNSLCLQFMEQKLIPSMFQKRFMNCIKLRHHILSQSQQRMLISETRMLDKPND